jgi:hypothetical protein
MATYRSDFTPEELAAYHAELRAERDAARAAALAEMTPEAIKEVDALLADALDAYNTLPCTKMGLRDLTEAQLTRLSSWALDRALWDVAKRMHNVPPLPDWSKVKTQADRAVYEAELAAHRVADDKRQNLGHALVEKHRPMLDMMAGIVRDPNVQEWRLPAPRTKLLHNEDLRRKRAITTSKNQTEVVSAAAPSSLYAVGETVEVHAMGHWYVGTVKSFNKNGRAVVTFTSGTGKTRDKTVSHDKIRKISKAA